MFTLVSVKRRGKILPDSKVYLKEVLYEQANGVSSPPPPKLDTLHSSLSPSHSVLGRLTSQEAFRQEAMHQLAPLFLQICLLP